MYSRTVLAAVPVVSVCRYAGFWIRVVASVLDTFSLLAALFPLRMLVGSLVTLLGMDAHMPTHGVMFARRIVRIAIGIVLAFAYRAGMESSPYQATLGKMAARLKVIDQEGQRISFCAWYGQILL